MVDTFESLNAKIARLTSYGLRNEKTTASGYKIVWSNGGACWYREYHKIPKGKIVTLDANQLIAYMDKRSLEHMLPRLDALPLYRNSFEYRFERKQ